MKFVDISKYKFVIEPRYYYFGWSKTGTIVGRESAVLALVQARKFLPKGYNFKIWDMQRPRKVQIAMLKSFERRFKIEHPKWTRSRIMEMVFAYGAKPMINVERVDTHRNGGAVDLTVVNKKGEELYMGTDHDDLTVKSATSYFEKIVLPNTIEKEARKNRKILIKAMTAAGWENYSREWWHWSFKN